MDKVFLLLLSPFDAEVQQVSWCLTSVKKMTASTSSGTGQAGSRGLATLDEFVDIYQSTFPDSEIIVVISGQHLTYTNVALTVKNQKQMLQALPFLVEEQIIGNIEDMHIVIPASLFGDEARIAIIEKSALENLKNIFARRKLSVSKAFGLPDLLVCSEDELHILLDEEFALVKNSRDCLQCDQVNLETMLELVSLENISTITISLHEINKNSLSLAKRIKIKLGDSGLKIQSSPFTEDTLDYIIRVGRADTSGSLDILQGDTSSDANRNKRLYQFLPLAWVAVLCLCLQIAFNIAAGWYFERLSTYTRRDAVSLYLKLFPEDKKVVNLASQLTAKANSSALNSKTGKFPTIFSSTINAMNAVAKPSDIQLKQFRYDETSGELKVGLDTNAISSLDKLKVKLAESGFMVEIISANEENGTIKATLSIKDA